MAGRDLQHPNKKDIEVAVGLSRLLFPAVDKPSNLLHWVVGHLRIETRTVNDSALEELVRTCRDTSLAVHRPCISVNSGRSGLVLVDECCWQHANELSSPWRVSG